MNHGSWTMDQKNKHGKLGILLESALTNIHCSNLTNNDAPNRWHLSSKSEERSVGNKERLVPQRPTPNPQSPKPKAQRLKTNAQLPTPNSQSPTTNSQRLKTKD